MEINTSNLINTFGTIDDMEFSRSDADIVYRLLMELGSTKDIKFHWNDGRIHIMKSFHYESPMMPTSDDDGKRTGVQYYTLAKYIKLLIKWDRSAYRRMKNVESKINQMHSHIEVLRKQL